MNFKRLIMSVSILIALSVTYVAGYAQTPIREIEMTFEELGYSHISINGLYGTASAWVPLQSNWEINNPVALDIAYIGSPLLNAENAVLTVKANGQSVSSIRPLGDGTLKTFRVVVPASVVQAPGFLLEFNGYLKLTDLQCEDTSNPGQWLIIQNTSLVQVEPSIKRQVPQLENLLDALVIQSYDNNPTPIVLVIPAAPSSEVLTATGRIMAYLGTRLTAAHLPLTVKSFADLSERDQRTANLVVVGMLDEIPFWEDWAEVAPLSPLDADFELAPDGALIQVFPSPWNIDNNILLLSAEGLAGIEQGGAAFAHRPTRQTFLGSSAVVTGLATLPEPQTPLPWSTAHTSFQQLGEVDRRVTGIGITDTYYFFRMPPGWVLSSGAQLVLHMAFSPALRSDESYAVVYINDVYVGTVNVEPQDGDIWVALDLPTRALNELARGSKPLNLDLQLSIANLLPTDSCDQINTDASWSIVYSDSYFTMPHDYALLPDLHAFPYPFVSDQVTPPTSIVLPQNPTPNDLQDAFSLVAILGKHTIQDSDVQILASNQLNQESHAEHNLIILGDIQRQPWLETFITETDPLRVSGLYEQLGGTNTGLLHAIDSPWSAEHDIVLAYGDTPEGFSLAAQALYESVPPVYELGSIALIREDSVPLILYRDERLIEANVVAAAQVISEASISLNPLVATATPQPEITPTTDPTSLQGIARTEAAAIANEATDTERLILMITAFLIILTTLAALGRIMFRLAS